MVDPVNKYPGLRKWFPLFDQIIGCTKYDEINNGIDYISTPCVNHPLRNIPIRSDIYIRAQDVGRVNTIEECFNYLHPHVKCDFHIQMNPRTMKESRPGLEYTLDRIPYEKMLGEELSSNVLLEVVVPGVGAGETLRYREAVMYGKKLLSNSPTIRQMPFYNEKYMRYFDDIHSIDIDWIKERVSCEYGYRGEFSIDSFCREILKMREKTTELVN